MTALAIAGAFPGLPVRHHRPVLDLALRRRVAAGFRPKGIKRRADRRSARADARYLGRWFGCLLVEARDGAVYRCRCRCGLPRYSEPRRIRVGDNALSFCSARCPLRAEVYSR